jgi:glutaminase
VHLVCIDINLEHDVLNRMLAHVVATKQVLANDKELIFIMYVHGTAVSIVQSKIVKM